MMTRSKADPSASLAAYLTPGRTVVLERTEREAALRELIARVCADVQQLDEEAVFSAVWNREQTLSTCLVPGIAIPHARIPSLRQSIMAVGKSKRGIVWDAEGDEPVKLVILIVGSENEHLRVLSRIAQRVSNEELYASLLRTNDPERLYALLTRPYASGVNDVEKRLKSPEHHCYRYAVDMAKEMHATALVVHADAVGSIEFLEEQPPADVKTFIIARDPSRYPSPPVDTQMVAIPFGGSNRSSQMSVAFLFLVSQGLLSRSDRVISVCGLPESARLDTIMLTDLRDEQQFFMPERGGDSALPEDIEPQVLARVIQVASSLSNEGREGKPVGTLFVLGDSDQVMPCCRQMVMNPFKGYGEDDRNILDPGLEETIKEFSRIDGAFVVRGDGVIESAGTYIRADGDVERLTPGLGARHAAAAMISRETHAMAIALSESTRKVSIYRGGQRILEI